MENTSYDIEGRIIKNLEPVTQTLYEYSYVDNHLRILTITNENNRSNYKTTKTQLLINGEYVDVETEEFGDTYHIKRKFSGKNKETYFEQRNLKTGKIHKKITQWQDDKPCIWVSEYNEEKSIGFYMSKNILTGLKR